jgi:hypothetical protein
MPSRVREFWVEEELTTQQRPYLGYAPKEDADSLPLQNPEAGRHLLQVAWPPR